MEPTDTYRFSLTTIQTHVWMLHASLKKLTGNGLVDSVQDEIALYEKVQEANFAVVSHGTEVDPIFNYANPQALSLFEMTWDQFTQLPSRRSAEAPNRKERARLLNEVASNGYIQDYSGIRISSSGKRFLIQNATVWNLHDLSGKYCGQAAYIPTWEMI